MGDEPIPEHLQSVRFRQIDRLVQRFGSSIRRVSDTNTISERYSIDRAPGKSLEGECWEIAFNAVCRHSLPSASSASSEDITTSLASRTLFLRIYVDSRFPNTKPQIFVSPPCSHPICSRGDIFVDENMIRVTDFPKLNSRWTSYSNLEDIVVEIIGNMKTFPPLIDETNAKKENIQSIGSSDVRSEKFSHPEMNPSSSSALASSNSSESDISTMTTSTNVIDWDVLESWIHVRELETALNRLSFEQLLSLLPDVDAAEKALEQKISRIEKPVMNGGYMLISASPLSILNTLTESRPSSSDEEGITSSGSLSLLSGAGDDGLYSIPSGSQILALALAQSTTKNVLNRSSRIEEILLNESENVLLHAKDLRYRKQSIRELYDTAHKVFNEVKGLRDEYSHRIKRYFRESVTHALRGKADESEMISRRLERQLGRKLSDLVEERQDSGLVDKEIGSFLKEYCHLRKNMHRKRTLLVLAGEPLER